MSTIDTVEGVLEVANTNEHAIPLKARAMLTRYAALLEAVNRPVSEDELAEATITYMRAGPKNGEGVNTTQLRAALEAHMAALREEVGK